MLEIILFFFFFWLRLQLVINLQWFAGSEITTAITGRLLLISGFLCLPASSVYGAVGPIYCGYLQALRTSLCVYLTTLLLVSPFRPFSISAYSRNYIGKAKEENRIEGARIIKYQLNRSKRWSKCLRLLLVTGKCCERRELEGGRGWGGEG